MRKFSDRNRENQDTHIIFNTFFFENLTVYEKTWKNTETKQVTDDTTRRIRFEYSITKAANAQSEQVIFDIVGSVHHLVIYEGRTESHEQHFFACDLGTADEGECGGRWNQLLCYP